LQVIHVDGPGYQVSTIREDQGNGNDVPAQSLLDGIQKDRAPFTGLGRPDELRRDSIAIDDVITGNDHRLRRVGDHP
jgi:hypothetical protein